MRVKTEAKRQSIVDAAAEVFMEKGYEAASMAEIASRAGGSKATLYSYFPSKEELFLMVMKTLAEERMSQAHARLTADGDLRSALLRYGEQMLRNLLSPEIATLRRIVLGEGWRSTVGQLFFDNGPAIGWGKLAAFLEGQMQAGKLRQARPWPAAMHLLGLLEAEFIEWFIVGAREMPSDAAINEAVVAAVEVFMAGYAPSSNAA
jgi:AcrR family transcriptional regulator